MRFVATSSEPLRSVAGRLRALASGDREGHANDTSDFVDAMKIALGGTATEVAAIAGTPGRSQ